MTEDEESIEINTFNDLVKYLHKFPPEAKKVLLDILVSKKSPAVTEIESFINAHTEDDLCTTLIANMIALLLIKIKKEIAVKDSITGIGIVKSMSVALKNLISQLEGHILQAEKDDLDHIDLH